LLPPESWLAYFPATTLLPPLSQMDGTSRRAVRRHSREAEPLYGILGARKIFHSIFERPIYFLRSHDGYHCGWCELDAENGWLTLVPSALTMVSHRRWRYRQAMEVVGLVNRVLTRLGFPKGLGSTACPFDKHSNLT
jgi:hypothetical protein